MSIPEKLQKFSPTLDISQIWRNLMIIIGMAIATLASSTVSYGGESGSISGPAQYVEVDSARDSTGIIAPETATKRKVAPSRVRLHAYGFISESYDDNILNYSDRDRLMFGTPLAPARRFAISRLDDRVTDVAARVSVELGRRRSAWRLRLKGAATLFAYNSYRHYTQWGVEIRKNIRRVYAEATFGWMPKFNLRNLYWRPMVGRPIGFRYAPADFSRLSYGVEVGAALSSRLDARINTGLELNNYAFPFDERDNRTVVETARLTYDLFKRLSITGDFGLAQCRAAGRDSVNAIVKDISYNARLAGLGIRLKCDRRGRIVAAGAIDYEHQKYLSVKPLDLSHYRRVDDDYEVTSSLSWRVNNHFQPELNYTYRLSRSNVIVSTADFGSYSANKWGVQVTSYF